MPDPNNTSANQSNPDIVLQFGEEMVIEDAGFSFHPIIGFELEVDGSVYMYSDDGNLEISMFGGEIDDQTSIAELNDELAADFMINFDQFELIEAGKITIQGITGFLNEIHFVDAEEEGFGLALICSPHINQYFFLLVISSAEYWVKQGQKVFSALKSQIHFHPQFKPTSTIVESDEYPDLTIETYESITSDEDIVITIEKGDLSLLMAARAASNHDEIYLVELRGPGEQSLCQYDPETDEFFSSIADQPLVSHHGELCLLLPGSNQQSLQIGDYRFAFTSKSGLPLQEVQVIIRHGRAVDMQKVDLNIWLASKKDRFNDTNYLAQFKAHLRGALTEQLAPMNLAVGIIEFFHPAPDELDTFASINIDDDLADCSYMIAESVENGRALNIGLFDRITQGKLDTQIEIKASSSGSPGMILSSASPQTCVLINYSAVEDNFAALAQSIIEQLIHFSGVHPQIVQSEPDQPQFFNQEIAWQVRRHPIFYNAD